jgi:two-component system chemotaxis response regulator CheY
LIVDDSNLTRKLLSQALQTLQIYDITYAEDGMDAKDRLEGINLVITDWMMPRMDGLEFTRWLRSQWKYRNLPVILITAEFEDSKIREAKEAGVNMFIEKTFSSEDLVKAVKMVTGL